MHAAWSALRENGGSVVLLTTDAGRYATPGESVLGAVGASIIMMTKALAKEFSRDKIPVNSIALALTSDTLAVPELYDACDSILAQKIAQVDGVGQTFCGGSAKPAEAARSYASKRSTKLGAPFG